MPGLLLHMVLVLIAQVLLFVALPAWALMRLKWRSPSEWGFASMVSGVCSAAILGGFLDGRGFPVGVAMLLWATVWIVGGFVLNRRKQERVGINIDWPVIAVLLLAWVVRSIHPLQTWALGQSDAYSHLGFIKDVLRQGMLTNVEYPAGYSWVMAFTSYVLRGDPYWVARFGGAFFGVGLVLGIYALLLRVNGRHAALAGAALAAGCPVFFLLQKTGVGSFANQMGLLLIPAALLCYVAGWRVLLPVVLVGMAVSVPIMLLHVVLLLGIMAVLDLRCSRAAWLVLGLLVLVLALLMGLSFALPGERLMVVARMLTARETLAVDSGKVWLSVPLSLLYDFISVKRWGFGTWLLNVPAVILAASFLASLVYGVARKHAGCRLVGVWGVLTSGNVILGVLQFSNYQREGWSMLIALAMLCGLTFGLIWSRMNRPVQRKVLVAGIAASVAVGLALPPFHINLGGKAESDVVEYLMGLDPSVTVLARNMSGFSSGQGDVVRTLHDKTISSVNKVRKVQGPVFFVRDRAEGPGEVSPVMRVLQPGLTTQVEKATKSAEEENVRMEQELSSYEVTVRQITPHLDVWEISAQ